MVSALARLLRCSAQFVLDGLDLLLEEVFALLLVDVLAGAHLDGFLDFGQLHLAVQDFQQAVSALAQHAELQEFYFFILFQGKVGADEVHQEHRVVDVADGER